MPEKVKKATTEESIAAGGEQKPDKISSIYAKAAACVAVILVIFHLLAASPFLTLNNTEQSVYHGVMVIIFFLLTRTLKSKPGKFVDLALIIITIIAGYEVIKLRNSNAASATLYSSFQIGISIIFVLVALFVAYRALGKILPTLCVVFLAYTLLGRYLPGELQTAKVTIQRFATYLMVSSEGLFGSALNVAAIYIFLFVIFGSVLSFIGAGEFFVKIAFAAFGKVCGGPAQAAVYSSMLMGMVNGSGAANVVTTGTFTIPLIKKTGFDKDTAGAVEAVASSGGQIMPPVMGAVAFLMSDATSIPYGTICIAALIPAVLYYITTSASIAAYSHRHKIPVREDSDNQETAGQILKHGWYYFLPIFVLIALMISGISTARAALYTILLCIVIGLITDHRKFTPRNLVNLCVDSAKSIMNVSIACMIVGIVVGSINITGLGLKISGYILALSGGHILVMGILTAIVCIILGMGLPTSACYIILSVLVAPAMVELGIATISAHMFVLYYGVIAALTPPVALAVFAAIGISGGDMWKTGLQAMKLAIAGFIIPFIFLYNTDILMYNSATGTFGMSTSVLVSFVLAALGCCCIAFGLFGWCARDLNVAERIILAAAGFACLFKHVLPVAIAGAIASIALIFIFSAQKRNKKERQVL